MDIGNLRHPIDIQELQLVQDPGTGEMIEQWVVIGNDWADIRGVSGREFLAAAATQAETTFRITIRYRGDIDTANRFVADGTTYEIEALLPDNKRRQLTCMCQVMP